MSEQFLPLHFLEAAQWKKKKRGCSFTSIEISYKLPTLAHILVDLMVWTAGKVKELPWKGSSEGDNLQFNESLEHG